MSQLIEYSTFYIGPEDVESGPRIGGAPPQKVKPTFKNQLTKYLMTVPSGKDLEISVFYSFDYFADGPFGFHDAAYFIHDESSRLVEVLQHKNSKRSKPAATLMSAVPGRGIICSTEREAEPFILGKDPYPFHKRGGVPVFDKEFDSAIGAKALDLMKEGFDHSIQLALPAGPDDSILDCDWPFGEAIFHVFTRVQKGEFQFRYCWG